MIKPLFFTACEKFFQMHFSFTVGIIIDNMINRKDNSKYIYLGRWRLVKEQTISSDFGRFFYDQTQQMFENEHNSICWNNH